MNQSNKTINYLAMAGGYYFVSVTSAYGNSYFGVFVQSDIDAWLSYLQIGDATTTLERAVEALNVSEYGDAGWRGPMEQYGIAHIQKDVMAQLEDLKLSGHDLTVLVQ